MSKEKCGSVVKGWHGVVANSPKQGFAVHSFCNWNTAHSSGRHGAQPASFGDSHRAYTARSGRPLVDTWVVVRTAA